MQMINISALSLHLYFYIKAPIYVADPFLILSLSSYIFVQNIEGDDLPENSTQFEAEGDISERWTQLVSPVFPWSVHCSLQLGPEGLWP